MFIGRTVRFNKKDYLWFVSILIQSLAQFRNEAIINKCFTTLHKILIDQRNVTTDEFYSLRNGLKVSRIRSIMSDDLLFEDIDQAITDSKLNTGNYYRRAYVGKDKAAGREVLRQTLEDTLKDQFDLYWGHRTPKIVTNLRKANIPPHKIMEVAEFLNETVGVNFPIETGSRKVGEMRIISSLAS